MLKSITFEVTGDRKLVCEGCEQRVEHALKTMEGVDKVRARAGNQRIEVLFDTAALDSATMAARIAEVGYQTEVVRSTSDSGRWTRASGNDGARHVMRIQLLYFPGCPNATAARDVLTRALLACGLPPQFEEIDVSAPSTPPPLREWGSPTILVDGVDVGKAAAPTGSCCRLYQQSCCESPTGTPSEAIICEALKRVPARPRGWLRALVALPSAVLPLLPSFTCPACLAAYAGVLSSLGLGFILNDRVQRPLIFVFLALTVATVAWTTRQHRKAWPLSAVLAGSLAVIAGRLVWSAPPIVYVGVAALLIGAVWNLALKRRGPKGRAWFALGAESERMNRRAACAAVVMTSVKMIALAGCSQTGGGVSMSQPEEPLVTSSFAVDGMVIRGGIL